MAYQKKRFKSAKSQHEEAALLVEQDGTDRRRGCEETPPLVTPTEVEKEVPPSLFKRSGILEAATMAR
jgi:hypothetical protein